jgi:hypothetical protein
LISAGGSALLGCAADPSDPRRRCRPQPAGGLTSTVAVAASLVGIAMAPPWAAAASASSSPAPLTASPPLPHLRPAPTPSAAAVAAARQRACAAAEGEEPLPLPPHGLRTARVRGWRGGAKTAPPVDVAVRPPRRGLRPTALPSPATSPAPSAAALPPPAPPLLLEKTRLRGRILA